MPTADYSSYHQPSGTGADGTKLDNFIDAVQATVNGLDNNNIATIAGIDLSKLAFKLLLPIDQTHNYQLQFGTTAGTTDGSGVLTVTYGTTFASATDLAFAVNGDTGAITTALIGVAGQTISGFSAAFGASHASVPARVNWLAIGH